MLKEHIKMLIITHLLLPMCPVLRDHTIVSSPMDINSPRLIVYYKNDCGLGKILWWAISSLF